MTVRVSKPALNIREKLSELDNPVGNHGTQLMKSADAAESFDLVRAGRKNIVINGNMTIDQRYGGSAHTIPGANTYVLDRWAGWSNQASKFSVQRVADAPTEEGLKYSSKCTSLSAFSAANGDWFGYNHRIEANNISQGLLGTANAKTFTLSFWVKSSLTGSWYGAIRTKGSSPDRSYPFDYTINNANTWEKKTLTFTGAVDGTWGSGTAEGICLWWDLGTGSTYQGDGYVWHSDNKTGIKASPFIAVNGATWYITGVQLELGTVATPFEHRSYGEELALCQRYYWQVNDNKYRRVNGYKRHDSNVHFEVQSPVPMRQAPAPTLSDGGIFTNFQGQFGSTQSNPTISEWNIDTGQGLIVIESNYSSTHLSIPSWEGYQLQLSAEL